MSGIPPNVHELDCHLVILIIPKNSAEWGSGGAFEAWSRLSARRPTIPLLFDITMDLLQNVLAVGTRQGWLHQYYIYISKNKLH
jgi:hypothetical protein